MQDPDFNQAIISVTLVDLIYLDSILHICFMCSVGTVANIHSLAKMEEGLTVDYTTSLIYAGMFVVQIMKLQFLQKGNF